MLTTNEILLSQAIIDSSSDYKVPMAVSKGMFPIKVLGNPYQATKMIRTKYSMSYDRFVAGRTDSNVIPTINARTTFDTVTSGIAEVQILYNKRYDDSVSGNSHAMHVGQVPAALVEINKQLSRKVDIAIFSSYQDKGDGIYGINGLNDYGIDIGNPAMDPEDYPAIYAFFGETLSYMTETLHIPASSINLFIGRQAVMAMDSVMLSDGNGQSIWQRLKAFTLADVSIFVLDSYLLSNQCRFVARNYSALCKPNLPFFMPQPEKDASGNKQFVMYIEYVLPSLVITDDNACLKQDDLFILPSSANRSIIKTRVAQEDKKNSMKEPKSEEKLRAKPIKKSDEMAIEFN